jgi:hypothetical protein
VVEELTPRHHQAATHQFDQEIGRDVLGHEDSLSAAIGVGRDDFERTTADAWGTLVTLTLYSLLQLLANAK